MSAPTMRVACLVPTVGGIRLATLGIGGAFAVSVVGYLVAAMVALRVRHRNTAALSTAAGCSGG